MMNYSKKSIKKSYETEINLPFEVDFKLSGEKYETRVSDCFVKKIKPNYVMSLYIPYEIKGEASIRVFVSFLGETGKELAKIYAENALPFTTVEGTAALKVEFAAFSKHAASVKAKEVYIYEHYPYTERKAVLAAAAVKYDKPKRTFENNLSDTLAAIDAAAAAKPDIIVASECFYGRNVRNLSLAERSVSQDSYLMSVLRKRAEKHKTNICFSAHTFLENGNIANLAVVIDRSGKTVGTYKKSHLTMGELLNGIEPGDEPGVFDLDFGRVGVAICWDMFFPEYTRLLQLSDVDVILNPTAGFKVERTARRAIETGAFIVTSGTHKCSESRIFAPDGKWLDKGDEKRGYAAAAVDLNKDYYTKWLSCLSYAQSGNVYKNERRPDMYK